MNTIASPSHLSVNVGVTCPMCRAKPGLACINQQGKRLRQCHRARLNKAKGKKPL